MKKITYGKLTIREMKKGFNYPVFIVQQEVKIKYPGKPSWSKTRLTIINGYDINACTVGECEDYLAKHKDACIYIIASYTVTDLITFKQRAALNIGNTTLGELRSRYKLRQSGSGEVVYVTNRFSSVAHDDIRITRDCEPSINNAAKAMEKEVNELLFLS